MHGEFKVRVVLPDQVEVVFVQQFFFLYPLLPPTLLLLPAPGRPLFVFFLFIDDKAFSDL